MSFAERDGVIVARVALEEGFFLGAALEGFPVFAQARLIGDDTIDVLLPITNYWPGEEAVLGRWGAFSESPDELEDSRTRGKLSGSAESPARVVCAC